MSQNKPVLQVESEAEAGPFFPTKCGGAMHSDWPSENQQEGFPGEVSRGTGWGEIVWPEQVSSECVVDDSDIQQPGHLGTV